ncbi:MAG: SPOR domain-containing protein [Deltaproteobacteria bacterium]|nr:SPOR domain-containing protein [Deltaproteobacteria bacterium]
MSAGAPGPTEATSGAGDALPPPLPVHEDLVVEAPAVAPPAALAATEQPGPRWRRAASPRLERLTFSVGRGAIALGLFVALAAGGRLFAAGYRLGQGQPLAGAEPPRSARAALDPADVRVAPGPGLVAAPQPSTPAPLPAPAVPPPDAPVEAPVQPADDAPKVQAPPPGPEIRQVDADPGPGFGLQLGAYPDEGEARDFVARHGAALAGQTVFLVEARLPGKGVWYRIRLGPYPDRRAVERAQASLPEELARGALVVRYR